MSAYTPRRSASRAWVRTLRASAMFTPSRRAASTSAAARSRIVSARAYLRWASAFSIAVEHRVRIGERIRDPRLAPRDFEGPSGGAREVERPSQVARGLGLLGALQQAPGKRRVGHVAARGDEAFASGRDRPFRDVGRRP